MDNLFNINQAAFISKVHPLTVRRYIREGKLKAVRVGGNIRIKESELQGFYKEITPPSKPRKSVLKEITTKVFTMNDPLFKLKGFGAHVQLSTK